MTGFWIGRVDMTSRCVLLALCLASSPALARAAEEAAAAVPAGAGGVVADDSAGSLSPAARAEADAAGAATTPGAMDAVAPASPDATSPPARAKSGPDPWEGFNRSVFRFNDRLDRYALKPVAKGYKKVTPRAVRTGVTNFYRNLKMPVVLLNDLLQGKPLAAGQDLSRFVVNSTVGIVGLFDPSSRIGIPQNDEDFGQTLGKWGVPNGPYLVLPLVGPSTVRDGAGLGVDIGTDPVTFKFEEGITFALWTGKVVNTRANLLDVEEIIQGDRYLFLRDLYLQSREFAVKDGRVESDPFLDEEDPGEADDPGAAAPDADSGEATPEAGASPAAGEGGDGAVQDNPVAPAPPDEAAAAASPEE